MQIKIQQHPVQLMSDLLKIHHLLSQGLIIELIDSEAVRFDLRYAVYDKIGINANRLKINENAELI